LHRGPQRGDADGVGYPKQQHSDRRVYVTEPQQQKHWYSEASATQRDPVAPAEPVHKRAKKWGENSAKL
jgi:hypothetical protein